MFESFEEGKTAMREAIAGFATSKNAMFDGNGHLINFDTYIDDFIEIETEEELSSADYTINPGWIEGLFYTALVEVLQKALMGEDVAYDFPVGVYEEPFIRITVTDGTLKIKGGDEGPSNDIHPKVETNIFDLTEEKHYYLYIDDFFGGLWGQECSSELYIDLKEI